MDEKLFVQFESFITIFALREAIEKALVRSVAMKAFLFENQSKECYMTDNDPIIFTNKLELFTKCVEFSCSGGARGIMEYPCFIK